MPLWSTFNFQVHIGLLLRVKYCLKEFKSKQIRFSSWDIFKKKRTKMLIIVQVKQFCTCMLPDNWHLKFTHKKTMQQQNCLVCSSWQLVLCMACGPSGRNFFPYSKQLIMYCVLRSFSVQNPSWYPLLSRSVYPASIVILTM